MASLTRFLPLVTTYYVLLNIPAQTVLALLLALLMNKKLRSIGVFRTIYVVPWMATPVAMGIVWQWIFDPRYGTLNTFLGYFGMHGIAWLTTTPLAMPSVAAVNIWQFTGYNMLFFLAGLQSIPSDLYEASSIAGASRWKTFWHVTLPLLSVRQQRSARCLMKCGKHSVSIYCHLNSYACIAP